MDANEKDQKIKDLTGKVEFLSSIIIKAHKYAKDDPEVALTQARKSAEAICRNIFSAEIGDPGKIMLDELIKKLNERKIIPVKILLPLGTIQAYGNYGTHAQSANETIDFNYITPCLSALAQVSSWYFTEYLKTTLPPGLVEENGAEPAPPAPPAIPEGGRQPAPPDLKPGPANPRQLQEPAAPEKPKSRGLMIGVLAVVVVVAIAVIVYFRVRTSEAQPLLAGSTPAADSLHAAAAMAPATAHPAKTDSLAAAGRVNTGPGPARKEESTPGKPSGSSKATAAPEAPASAHPSGAATPPAPAGPTVDPSLLKEVTPQYPRSLKSSGIAGEVRLRILVDSTGVPADVRILSYDNEKFKQPAIDAARQYRFKPALSSGKPVSAWTLVKMTIKEE